MNVQEDNTKNERIRFGITQSRRKQFDKQNPRNQMFTKELLAKYINTYHEVYHGKKLIIGPHIVVRGSQKNYAHFLHYNFDNKPDNIYFEDAVALAIIFKAAEKIYGISPNSIGDMRYITVPYSIAWLGFILDYQLDLYKIWKDQDISSSIKDNLYPVMTQVEKFIKSNAPGSLYGEWAKKEECWNAVKEQDFGISPEDMKDDLITNVSKVRKRNSENETLQAEIDDSIARIRSVHQKTWNKIEEWGKSTGNLSTYQCDMVYTINQKVKNNKNFSDIERTQAESIIDLVANQSPDVFFDMENFFLEDIDAQVKGPEITLELVKNIVQWDKINKRLKPYEFRFMADLAEGKKGMNDRNKFIVGLNLKKVKKHGFHD